MLVGHLATALVARRIEPRVGLGTAVAAAFGLDLLWPLLLLFGVESVRVSPDTAFTHLAFASYPWSHSFLMVLVWSGAAMFVARRVYQSGRAGLVVGGLVLSHWVLDFVSHRPDLPLWPGGPLMGLGLWNSIAATIAVEGALFVGALAAYTGVTHARDAVGRWAFVAFVALLGIIWVTQPWSPPPPSARAVAWAGIVMWLLPPWAHWFDSHRTLESPRETDPTPT